ncbi:polysaccharide deacetylase [Gemmiger formicilis]|nr:polysaccharide deacetylase family protein [Gemmiger formicilis]MBM6899348.1 polysaccharide deacetylase [Gemmiger formicilis]
MVVLLVILVTVVHLLYHQEYAETAIPNDCFAVSAATGETALPKQVCLTFDDGPSSNTQPLLDILAREKVPATFFVCAQDINQEYLPLVRTIQQQGHQVAMHSATHRYATIYRSPEAFWQDIKTLRQALEPYLSLEDLTWLRFPGGSTNTVSHKYGGSGIMKTLKAQTEEKGWHWIDWNVCGEDATASHPDADRILRNIQEDAEDLTTCVVLLHDTKATGETVKALPQIIGWFREKGYTFCTVEQLAELQSSRE